MTKQTVPQQTLDSAALSCRTPQASPGGPPRLLSTALILAGLWAGLWAGLFVPSAAMAHEFWLEPSTFRPELDQEVAVRIFVGDGFEHGEPYPRNPAHLRSFTVVGETARPIDGRVGSDPAGSFAADSAGTLTISYRSGESTITLEADRFESYLADEGLEHISRLRAEAGDSAKPGREAFSRCAKALVRVGDDDAGYGRHVGLDLEIVAERDPFTLRAGDTLPLQVLWQGAPLAGTKVLAFVKGAPEETQGRRTDAEGRLQLTISEAGVWLVSTVHMEPAAPDSAVDWLSTWSSLTFEISP